MALYRVVCDGTDLLDYSRKDLVLLNPHLDMEVNTAGSLEFVMPPYHAFYDSIQILRSTIEVYEDDQLLWFGRPIETSIDFYKQKTVFCEGPLAFFNDTIMFPVEFDGELNTATVQSFWKYIIEQHNKQMSNPNRKFEFGECTMPDKSIYRKLNYENAHDALQQMCLDAEDGYFFFRRVGGVNYFDWYKEMPYACNQPIEFGKNLLDLTSDFNASSMATCVIPLGKSVDGRPITIDSVNNGSDILVSEAAQTYGRIIHVKNFSDISDPTELKAEGEKYLSDSQFNSWKIQCTAADLHSQNRNLDSFTVGQQVQCVSNPHLINRSFPISKITINLDSAAKVVTLGIIKRKSLTRIRKEDNESAVNDSWSSSDSGSSTWEIDPPTVPGDTPTMSLMPTGIVIETPPNKTVYQPGETIDYTGIKVRIMCGDQVWKKRPLYPEGYALFNELTFSAQTAPSIENFGSQVIWTYNGQRFTAMIALRTSGQYTDKYFDDGYGPWLLLQAPLSVSFCIGPDYAILHNIDISSGYVLIFHDPTHPSIDESSAAPWGVFVVSNTTVTCTNTMILASTGKTIHVDSRTYDPINYEIHTTMGDGGSWKYKGPSAVAGFNFASAPDSSAIVSLDHIYQHPLSTDSTVWHRMICAAYGEKIS